MTWAYLSMYRTYHTGEKQYIPLQLHLHTTSIQRSHRFDGKKLMVILFELCVVQKSLKLDHQFQHVIHGHNIVSSASLWNCLGSTSWSSARWNMHWKYHANSATCGGVHLSGGISSDWIARNVHLWLFKFCRFHWWHLGFAALMRMIHPCQSAKILR